MQISSGLAEISFLSGPANRIKSQKFHVWPVYGNGKLNRIQGITRQMESNVVYTKPLLDDHNRLLDISKKSTEIEYTSTGTLKTSNALSSKPGSFFDAMV